MWSNYSEASKSSAREMINAKPTAETYTRTLNIDTRFRDNYYKTDSTNFHVSLPVRIKGVTKMSLSSLELPLTFFTISAALGNNYFYVYQGDTPYKITLSDGNYTPKMLETELKYAFDYYSGGVLPYEAVVDKRSKRVIISQTDPNTPFTMRFDLDKNGNKDLTNLQMKLGWLMGYRFGTYSGNHTYVSEGTYILRSPRYLFLKVDDYNNTKNDGFMSAFNSSILLDNILAKISVADEVNENVYILTMDTSVVSGCWERKYSGPVDIEKLKIQLVDEFGRIVDLNNNDFSFSLDFECINN